MKFIILIIDGHMYRIDQDGYVTDVDTETLAM